MIALIFLVLALVLFLVAGAGIAAGRWSLLALGLAAWVASELVTRSLGH